MGHSAQGMYPDVQGACSGDQLHQVSKPTRSPLFSLPSGLPVALTQDDTFPLKHPVPHVLRIMSES